MTTTDEHSSSYYELLFSRQLDLGQSANDAAVTVAEAFLDGKPARSGKFTATDRLQAFWSSAFLMALPSVVWLTEPMVLALARYMGQERYANLTLIAHVASVTPEAVRRAARYSGLVLRQHSLRWGEIEALRHVHAAEFDEFVRIFEIFDLAHRERGAAVALFERPLALLTPLELLVYASLYAFEHLVPRALGLVPKIDGDIDMQEGWDAINDLLAWKLTTCDPRSLQLSDADIGSSLRQHLSPFLFPSREGSLPRDDLYRAFQHLMDAQMELNSFISQSTDALSYDDGIRFVRNSDRLEILEVDTGQRAAWERDSEKLTRLHSYWLYRGMDALMASESMLAMVGPENFEANLQAFAKSMGSQLQLQEVYGLAETVRTESGLPVDVFRALLAMELMTAFFMKNFLRPYGEYLEQFGDGRLALGRLAFVGLLQGDMQNRFPITWSDKAAKVERIKSWTVSSEFPQGHAKAAEAILDFWTSDWTALSARLRSHEPGLQPTLLERPMLKMGRHLFQLPWMVALQNNATAAINNLRRIGSRRMEAREETRRIEQRLGEQFERRGFRVLANHQPAVLDEGDAGEIDLLCARDGHLLVLEVKSTFLRRSKKDAWMHGTTTLRKAGLQLHRKLRAVRHALTSDPEFLHPLGLSSTDGMPTMTGWIVDTSIECDHQRFSGFLKVSLEEVLIALRDDRRLLNDPDGLLRQKREDGESPPSAPCWTLYTDGFSAARFIEVIDQESVWAMPK
ncbi:MAG: hypothetical protein Q8O29_12610 [Polaromonas sp.]|uniref:hypothetical protein n=1 Tax=Polaromonas sp. TaxID=1869339 RepID=UPI0027327B2D|nr:hypothetical protein [Polaromonas sp.]MDP2819086.1 hypothetical protein [Polaromonas sp.]